MRSGAADGAVCPNAQENGEIRPSNAIRAGRGADGGPHLVSVLREGRKSTKIRSSSGVIRGIPDKNIARQKTWRQTPNVGWHFLKEASMSRMLLAIMTIATVALFASEAWTKSFPIKRVSKDSLEGSCKAAGGSSIGFSGGGYGCVNNNCDGKGGTCAVHCNKSGCYGHTPIVAPKGKTADGVLGKRPGATATRNPPPPRDPKAGQLRPTGSRVVNPTQTLQPQSGSQTPQPKIKSQPPQPQNFSGADRGARSEGRGSSRR